jgi:hypothetical protein
MTCSGRNIPSCSHYQGRAPYLSNLHMTVDKNWSYSSKTKDIKTLET